MEKEFSEIRLTVFENWLDGLKRTRAEGELSDNYGDSYICKWQNKYVFEGKHCSVLCSIADWLGNVSDLLDDGRYDHLTTEHGNVLFRYYTRVLLIVSEIIEDFVGLHAKIKGINKSQASRELEKHGFQSEELLIVSNYINSVCKHKIEKDNLHVHNHHLEHEFEDFGAKKHENQIRLDNLSWKSINHDTTIFLPCIQYFTGIVIKLNQIFDKLLTSETNYKEQLEKVFVEDWSPRE